MRSTNGNPKCKNEDGTPKVDTSKRTTLLKGFSQRFTIRLFAVVHAIYRLTNLMGYSKSIIY